MTQQEYDAKRKLIKDERYAKRKLLGDDYDAKIKLIENDYYDKLILLISKKITTPRRRLFFNIFPLVRFLYQ